MEWIKDYWYLVLLGLVGVIFFFGHRTKKSIETNVLKDSHDEPITDEKANHGGHGCCH